MVHRNPSVWPNLRFRASTHPLGHAPAILTMMIVDPSCRIRPVNNPEPPGLLLLRNGPQGSRTPFRNELLRRDRLGAMLCPSRLLRFSMFTCISNSVRIGLVWALNESAYSGCAHLPRLLDYLFKQGATLTARLDFPRNRLCSDFPVPWEAPCSASRNS
jgi:hypothetical protein